MARIPADGPRPMGLVAKDWIARGLVRLVARLPLTVIHRLGAGVGWAFSRWPNRQRRNALINIGLCLPELSHEEQRRLRDRNLAQFGKTYME
ncbi:MAG: lipid A biosynthesis acyltransferase, partial [Chromatiaceae bacterium]